jgi:hypothetical protein
MRKFKLDKTNLAYGISTTAEGTATKVVTIPSDGNTKWTLVPGSQIQVKFSNTNTAETPKLDVNGTGAKAIDFNTKLNYLIAGKIYTFVYDGTNYVLLDEYHRVDGLGGDHAEVFNNPNNIASGDYAHAEGINTKASAIAAHAEGGVTIASGNGSHAEGTTTTAEGESSHAEGRSTTAEGESSHAEGYSTWALGEASHTEGYEAYTEGVASHAEGHATSAKGNYSHAEGIQTVAEGNGSHAEGVETLAKGYGSHAEGGNMSTEGIPYPSAALPLYHWEGSETYEINSTTAEGDHSHAEGIMTLAYGDASHSEGGFTVASGESSHAEGCGTLASGTHSHAEGGYTIASGWDSHAEGYYTIANGDSQHVQGKYNIPDEDERYAHIVGNGSYNARSNAYTLDWEGNSYQAGKTMTMAAGAFSFVYNETTKSLDFNFA